MSAQDEARYSRGTLSEDDRFSDQIAGFVASSECRRPSEQFNIRLSAVLSGYTTAASGLTRLRRSKVLEFCSAPEGLHAEGLDVQPYS